MEKTDIRNKKIAGALQRMKNSHYTHILIALLLLSLVGWVIMVKFAYANPLNLPSYALANPKVRGAYTYAAMNEDKLNGLPCDCGCMAEDHSGRIHSRGLVDCFMDGDALNGGAWDSHASKCGICYEDTLIAKSFYEQGKSKNEVKEALVEIYSARVRSNETVYADDD